MLTNRIHNKLLKTIISAGLISCTFNIFAAPLVLEGSAEENGLIIAKASKAKGEGWKDSTAKMTMVLRNAHGQESTR